MVCKKCKAEIPDGSVYCNMCGIKQVSSGKPRKSKMRGNGLGSVYKRGDGWKAEICVYINGRRYRRTKEGFPTKKAANDYIPTLKNEPLVQSHAEEKRTLAYYYESLAKNELTKLGKNTQSAYRTAWKKMDSIAQLPVKNLSIIMLRDVVSEEATSHDTASDMKTLLKKIFDLAIADGVVEVNMANYIPLPKKNETEQTPWNNDEVAIIWSAYDQGDKLAAYLLLMIYTGMMPGEVMICKRDMIDFDRRIIQGAGLKTKVRRNTPIVIAELVIPVLNSILDFSKDREDGKILIWHRDKFYDEYHAFLKRHKLPELPMYSCRHTTATALAVGAKIAPSIVQRVMRHARITTTQHYIHAQNSDALEAVNRLTKGI